MAFQASANSTNTSTPKLSKADERLARELELFDSKPDDALVSIKLVCAVRAVAKKQAEMLKAMDDVEISSNSKKLGPVDDDVMIIILKEPLSITRKFVAAKYAVDDVGTLKRRSGYFYAFNGVCYREISDDVLRSKMYGFVSRVSWRAAMTRWFQLILTRRWSPSLPTRWKPLFRWMIVWLTARRQSDQGRNRRRDHEPRCAAARTL